MSQKIAIYPGTFDPITFGHADIIKRAASIFDTLIIAAIDTHGDKQTCFSADDRVNMIKSEVQRINLHNIHVTRFSGLLVDFAAKQGVNVLIRGIRALSDFEYEFQMSYINHKLNPTIQTLFIPATEEGHFISSSFVKQLARLQSGLSNFVSPFVADKLRQHYAQPSSK
jgi:pantetheine-phosphate adenylyltransferase